MPVIEARSRQTYDIDGETTILLQVAAQNGPSQSIQSETLAVDLTPPGGQSEAVDVEEYELPPEGNRMHRFTVGSGRLAIDYRVVAKTELAVVDDPQLSHPIAQLPPETLRYTVPSRYCESDKLADWAAETFGELHPDDSRVMAIANWIYEQFEYTPGATGPQSSAVDVLDSHAGVCRDYAHLMIATCRALDIPARYVSGYVANLEPPDFHALVEVYVGDGWYLFDPTRLAPRTGLIRIARGLDAAETAFCTIVGNADLVEQSVLSWRHDEFDADEPVRVRVQ